MKHLFMCMAMLCLLNPLFAGSDHEPQIVRIADFVPTNIQLEADSVEAEYAIGAPGASFIKVHFDYFNLPDGAYVEVRDPRGLEVYRYGMNDRDDFTHDQELGEDGWESFAAMSPKINARSAFLRL